MIGADGRSHSDGLGTSESFSARLARMEARSASSSSSSEDISSSKIEIVVERAFIDFVPVAFPDADGLPSLLVFFVFFFVCALLGCIG